MFAWARKSVSLALFCHCAAHATVESPQHLAERVIQRIIQDTQFSLHSAPAAAIQEGSYPVHWPDGDGSGLWFKSQLAANSGASENHLAARDGLYLGVAGSPGTLKLWQGKRPLLLALLRNDSQPKNLDYQSLHFPLTVPVNAQTGTPVLGCLNADKPDPRVYLGLLYPNSGMLAKRWQLNASDNQAVLVARSSDCAQRPTDWQAMPQFSQWHSDDPLGYADWRYFSGTFMDAMLESEQLWGVSSVKPYVQQHFATMLAHLPVITEQRQQLGLLHSPYGHWFRFSLLDDFGPQTAVLAQLQATPWYDQHPQREWFENTLERAKLQLAERVPRLYDGTLARLTPYRLTVQSDDLFMGGILLIRLAQQAHDWQPMVDQVLGFHRHLYEPSNGLYRHGFFAPLQQHSSTSWGRGVGWMALAMSELLDRMPPNNPGWPQVLAIYRPLMQALVQVQSADGRWHQVLDDPSTYLETSATAMFVRALALGLANGWLEDDYSEPTQRAWRALLRQVDAQGNVRGIVRGTPIFASADGYAAHTTRINDPRGLGAVLYAANAVYRWKNALH